MDAEKIEKNEILAENNRRKSGKRNLMILGIMAVLIAIAMVIISLTIYYRTGDYELDHSRPEYMEKLKNGS